MPYPAITLHLKLFAAMLILVFAASTRAEVTRIEITDRQTLSSAEVDYQYEIINGIMTFTLDPANAENHKVYDIQHAQTNEAGLVEFSADFRLMVPSAGIANGSLLYLVNNRGGPSGAPGDFPEDPLYAQGFTYLLTGWINELEAGDGRILLNAPLVGSAEQPITGDVRYEVIVGEPDNGVNIAGGGHLAYEPTEQGLANASLTHRINQLDTPIPIERSQFDLAVSWPDGRNQPIVTLNLDGGLQPGHIYELVYEARSPVLAGAGMAGIRDSVALVRHGADEGGALAAQLSALGLPAIEHTIALGNSQSGRLLRLFLYDGFNVDLDGRRVFDGVIPVIAGAGFGMFNNRFAMPTRTNGQHENELFPNDLFPFTYGISTDPYSGRSDGILRRSMETGTVPRVMHIQTSNEYWIRGGSLPHTDPWGTTDAEIPDYVRFYSIGGSQHGSGNGLPRASSTTQLPRNPNMWAPFSASLQVAMHQWLADGVEPPPSRYPKLADGTLVPSHLPTGEINPQAWNPLPGINHPKDMYRVAYADYGERWQQQRIIDIHPRSSDDLYGVLVPAVDRNNNDLPDSTLLPPLTQVPLATFVPWNLRSQSTGAETELARLAGGYIPFDNNREQSDDPRNTIDELYSSFEDYLAKYEAVTDRLIEERYLLPEYKDAYMAIARANKAVFD
ncbi:MAG: alpha/beta hydrolase domain-containing protein [Gammaproteobacteria bacterium]